MISDNEKAILIELQRLPLVSRPFFEIAQRLNLTEDEVLDACNRFLATGIVRRFGPSVAHRKMGFIANPMTVLKVPKEDVEAVGAMIATSPDVSHCYARDGWKYNLFFMLHASSVDGAKEKVKAIIDKVVVKDYQVFFSSREFKKISFELASSEPKINHEKEGKSLEASNCS